MKKQTGFTIVELLIVIVVIGILAMVSVVSYNGVQQRTRDTIRLRDANTITQALTLYHIDHARHFGPTSSNGGWETSAEDTPADFMRELVTKKYLPTVPVDPENSSARAYYFYRYSAGYAGCDISKGQFYVFAIKDMETSSGPHSQSPGWTCPSRDWETEFDWVTGGFENP